MDNWASHSLSDFLLFSPRVYERLFVLYNQDIWPGHIAALAVGLYAVYALLVRSENAIRIATFLVGLLWLWIAWAFFANRYATINWAAVYFVPLFVVQGIVLIATAIRRFQPNGTAERLFIRSAPLAALSLVVVAYPLIAVASGRNWQSAEVFGLAPDPTAIATLAILAMHAGRNARIASLIPVLWCMATGLTLHTLGSPEFALAPVAGLILFALGWQTARSAPRTVK